MDDPSTPTTTSLHGRIKFVRRVSNDLKVLRQNLDALPPGPYADDERVQLDGALELLDDRAKALLEVIREATAKLA